MKTIQITLAILAIATIINSVLLWNKVNNNYDNGKMNSELHVDAASAIMEHLTKTHGVDPSRFDRH